MFERFTERAIKVMMIAQDESRRLGHTFVGTEFILLGLIGESKERPIPLNDARVAVEKIIGRGSGEKLVEIPFTPNVKRLFELTWDLSKRKGHDCITTYHLWLALIAMDGTVASKAIADMGADVAALGEWAEAALLKSAAAIHQRRQQAADEALALAIDFIRRTVTGPSAELVLAKLEAAANPA